MTIPRDSVTVLYIVREGYGNQSINYFIEQTKTGIAILDLGQSEWHLLANHSCWLSSEQLFAGLVQVGKSSQLKRIRAVG